jgi:coproporphyrinogen III oxidase-like Fe-S oxidoreductase
MKCLISGFFPAVSSEEVKEEEAKFEFVMLALRTAKGLSLKEYEATFGNPLAEDFPNALKASIKYLEMVDGCLKIKDEYLYVQNSILMPFIEEIEQ